MKTKEKQLLELLALVGGIQSTKWETVKQLVDAIIKGNVTIKNKKWADGWKNKHLDYHPLDLAEIKNWSTYDNTCIDLKF